MSCGQLVSKIVLQAHTGKEKEILTLVSELKEALAQGPVLKVVVH